MIPSQTPDQSASWGQNVLESKAGRKRNENSIPFSVEPPFNELPRDRGNAFVKSRVR